MEAYYQDYYTRLADKLNSGEIIKDIPNWICRNTRLNGVPYTFKDHEFQIAILKDQAQESDTMKCSQVGLTEAQLRFVMAYMQVKQQVTAIYVMPTMNDAKKITKSRIDPIIESSPMLAASVRAGTDSATMKQFGLSFLHIGGAESTRGGISTPAQVLIIDEYDFCNPRVLGIYNSRTRHAQDRMLKRRFSTPTVSNYGIALNYSRSDMHRYQCKCLYCNTWQAPDFFKQVVIPGFDKSFEEFDVDDLVNDSYKIASAYIRCTHCGKELDKSLAIAAQREWVAAMPSRSARGWSVRPFDLIAYNTTSRVIEQLKDYTTRQDYYNFVHGLPLDTDENKINDKMVLSCCVGDWVDEGKGWYIGIDVGKVCHIVVGRKINGKKHVVWFGKLRISEGSLITQIAALVERFNFERIVIDHGPDVSIPAGLQDKFGSDVVHPCVYVKGRKDRPDWLDLKDDTGFVNVARTRGIDACVQSINAGKWIFPRTEKMEEVRKHLQQMVRIEKDDDNEGDMVAVWEKATDSDHYFHAIVYLNTAMEMDEGAYSTGVTIAPTSILGVSVGAGYLESIRRNAPQSSQHSELAGMFGRMRS